MSYEESTRSVYNDLQISPKVLDDILQKDSDFLPKIWKFLQDS